VRACRCGFSLYREVIMRRRLGSTTALLIAVTFASLAVACLAVVDGSRTPCAGISMSQHACAEAACCPYVRWIHQGASENCPMLRRERGSVISNAECDYWVSIRDGQAMIIFSNRVQDPFDGNQELKKEAVGLAATGEDLALQTCTGNQADQANSTRLHLVTADSRAKAQYGRQCSGHDTVNLSVTE
jgi:hypothetical protein